MTMSTVDTYQDTVDKMMDVIRPVTLRRLAALVILWEQHQAQSPMGALMQGIVAPSTRFIMDQLKCGRRCAHDYMVTIQLIQGDAKIRCALGVSP